MIIGLTGRARSGKTTASESIAEHATQKGLTAGIYEISGLILAYSIQQGHIPNKTRAELNDDELAVMVAVGGDKRKGDPDFWLRGIEAQIQNDSFDVAIVPNIRCLNEAAMVWNSGGSVIRVQALNSNGTEFISRDRDPNNPLETGVYAINADYFITTKRGESALVSELAITLFEFLWALKGGK